MPKLTEKKLSLCDGRTYGRTDRPKLYKSFAFKNKKGGGGVISAQSATYGKVTKVYKIGFFKR